MPFRSPRTILAFSAAMALTVAALAPAGALAKGPNGGGGNADCDGDCAATQSAAQQQVRARDGSGANQAVQTRASAGGGGQVRARPGDGAAAMASSGTGQARNSRQSDQDARQSNRNGGQGQNARNAQRQNAKNGAGQGPDEDGQRGPGSCDGCDAEMGTLTEDQVAGLVFMANEEKLAHDVYTVFAEQYGVPIFSNIAQSESMHQQAVNVVLERYGLEDTAIALPAGEFSDPLIASLYDTLIEQGSASLEEAIAVGVLIEETDIADLESRMEDLETSAPDVHEMYSHLLAASQNHLAAFESWL